MTRQPNENNGPIPEEFRSTVILKFLRQGRVGGI